MGETNIGWADCVWNPILGCSRVSAGCANCYAVDMAHRIEKMGTNASEAYKGMTVELANRQIDWSGEVRLIPERLVEPTKWRKPSRVFVNSMSDLFHESLSNTDIDRVFQTIEDTAVVYETDPMFADEGDKVRRPKHTWLILTKRAKRMLDYLNDIFDWECPAPSDIWFGVSVENQETADERMDILYEVPAISRWVSIEPLLGGIDLGGYLKAVRWVVVGGESGWGYRKMNMSWLSDIVRQCDDAGVPVFVKQDSCIYPGRHQRIPDELWARKDLG